MFSINIDHLKPKTLLDYLAFIVALVIPGFGFVYLTHYYLFLSIDSVKLVMLSIMYGLPVLLVGLETAAAKSRNKDDILLLASLNALLYLFVFAILRKFLLKDNQIVLFYIIPLADVVFIQLRKVLKGRRQD